MSYCHYVFLMLLALLNKSATVKFTLDTLSELPDLTRDGQERFEILQANVEEPRYGLCWSNAVSSLQVGCRSLSQEMLGLLAIRLSDCFLQMSGQETIKCDVPHQDCLKSLTDRQFIVYTEFYTHSQNICYFLQSKIWHEESEATIDRLSSTSFKVSLQLEEAEKSQAALLKQQRMSVALQEELGRSLKNSQESMSGVVRELRAAASDHQQALTSLFQQMSILQSWLVGELSWFDSLVFYCSSVVMTCILTSSNRTRAARLPIFAVLAITWAIETCLAKNVASAQLITVTIDELNSWVWFFRRTCTGLCIAILVLISVTYRNYETINYHILIQIQKENAEMVKLLRQVTKGQSNTNEFQSMYGRVDVDFSPSSVTKQIHRQVDNPRKEPNVFVLGRQEVESYNNAIDRRDVNCEIAISSEIVAEVLPLRRSNRLQHNGRNVATSSQ